MLKSNLILPLICVSFIGCTSFDEIQPSVENKSQSDSRLFII